MRIQYYKEDIDGGGGGDDGGGGGDDGGDGGDDGYTHDSS